MKNEDIFIERQKLPVYHSRLSQAKKYIREALKQCNRPYLAFSGGKDSTVVHGLVAESGSRMPRVWSDDEWWLPETLEYMERVKARGHEIRQIQTKTKHADFFISHEDDGVNFEKWVVAQGYDAVFLGLRAQENARRRMALKKYGPIHRMKDGLLHVNPIAWWDVEDVWTYIHCRRIDYNKAYDKLEDLGLDLSEQRIGPLAVDRVLGYGQLHTLQRGWPNLFAKFVAKYPEARNYL